MAVELATAYISLVPSAKGISDKLREELGAPLEKAAREQGRRAGEELEDGFSKGIKRAAAGLATAFAGVQVGQFLKGAIDAAASTGEALSKLGVLVGDNADDLAEWSKTTAKAFGVSRLEALQATGVFANFFRGAGVGQAEAAKMSKAMVELAADMASFNDASPTETLDALRAGLVGETEPLRAFGVNLDDATLRLKALDLGLVENTKTTLPPAIKMQAAYAAILEQTSLQQGDYARTSDSLANKQKALRAQFADVTAELGAGLLPIAQRVVGAIGGGVLPAFEKAIPVLVEMVDQVFSLASGFAELVAPAAGVVGILGGFGAGAIATGLALSELAEGAVAAKEAMQAFFLSTSTLGGGLVGLASVLGGAALLAFTKFAADAAAAEERQKELTTALSEAGDPAQGLVDRLNELTGSLSDVKKETEGATEGVRAVDAVFAQAEASADKTEQTFIKLGISAQDMADVTREGGKAFDDAAAQALNLEAGTSDLALATERASETQRAFIEGLFAAQASGKITTEQLGDMLQTLDDVSTAWDDTRAAQTASIQADIDKAISLEAVTASWVEDQRAASGAKDEYGQLLFIGTQLAAVLDTQAGSADASAAATAGMGTEAGSAALSASDLAASQEEAAEAAKEHKNQLDGLARSVTDFIGLAQLAEVTEDSWATTVARLTEQVTAQTSATVEGAGAVDGFTAAAIENRASIRDLVDIAQEDIQAKIRQGATTQEISAIAAGWAGRLNDVAAVTGIGADATDRYEQQLLDAAAAVGSARSQLESLDSMEVYVPVTIEAFYQGLAANNTGSNFNLAALAEGGPARAGEPYVVGEEGPELFVPDVNGTVIPNGDLVSQSIGDMWADENGTLYAEVVVKLDGREIQRNQTRIERAGR
jgi:hypothetical protein